MQIDSVSLRGSGVAVYSKEFRTPDIMGFQLNFENLSASGTVAVILQHSADGENFIDKTTLISGGTAIATGDAKFASDAGTTPALGIGRLKITPTTTATGQVNVFLTGRAH